MFHQIKRLLKQSMVYGLGGALNQFLSLLILPLFTAYLTPADYGVNSVLGLFSAFLIGTLSLGLGNSIGLVYFEHSDPDYRHTVINSSLLALLPSMLLMLIAAWWSKAWVSQMLFQTDQYQWLVLITFLTGFFSLINLPLGLKLQFEEKSVATVSIYSLVTFFGLALSTLLIVVCKMGILGRFLGNGLGILLLLILMLASCWKTLAWKFNATVIKELFRYGLPAIPSFFFYFILQQGNIYILKEFSNLNEVGLYSVGMTFGNALSLGVSSFTTAWTPFAWSFKEKPEEARKLFGRIMSYYFLSVGSLSICLYLFAKPLVLVFTHHRHFYEAWRVIGLSSTGQFMVGVLGIIGVEHYMAKDIKYGVIIQGITALCFVLLSLVLTPAYQGLGAAMALCLSHLFMNALLIYWNYRERHRYLNVKYENKRINQFIFFYLFIIALTFLEGDAFSWVYFLLHLALLGAYVAYIWFVLLTRDEKNFVVNKVKHLIAAKRGAIGA